VGSPVKRLGLFSHPTGMAALIHNRGFYGATPIFFNGKAETCEVSASGGNPGSAFLDHLFKSSAAALYYGCYPS
jgi:hypothetical protein